ncbi:MAG TPA: non-homologous end-joining DNA ligase [Anaeromyxobacteraceae bacterium]
MSPRQAVGVEIEGRRLELSNLDKVFYPATGFTKGQVIDYYQRIAPALLPHLRDRPLTLKRYPGGVEGPFFYEKRCPAHRPAWVRTAEVWSSVSEDVIHFCVVDDLATLIWAVNLADLEMHTYLHRAPQVERPTALVFDLDPGAPADAVQCCEVALLLRDLFDRLGLQAFPKSSGSKGLQVYVPLNSPVDYDATKAFARAVAELLERERPELVVSSMKKELRVGRVLVDWSQNDRHKTTVCVWSLRAKERPTVSTPLRWGEVEAALGARDPAQILIEAPEALGRFAKEGDLFAPVLTLQQRLPALERLAGGASPRRKTVRSEAAPAGPAVPAASAGARRGARSEAPARPRTRKAGPGGRRPPQGHRPHAAGDGYVPAD